MSSTSAAAWRELKSSGKLQPMQSQTLAALRRYRKPVTARELGVTAGCEVWKRLSELERRGLVRRADARRCRVTGRLATTWEAVR